MKLGEQSREVGRWEPGPDTAASSSSACWCVSGVACKGVMGGCTLSVGQLAMHHLNGVGQSSGLPSLNDDLVGQAHIVGCVVIVV